MTSSKISWKDAILISIVSLLFTLIAYFVSQVIWGDLLHEFIAPLILKLVYYTIIDVVLLLGILIIFGLCLFINLFIFRNFTFKSKAKANTFAIIITLIALFICGFVSMFFILPDSNIYEILALFPYYYVFLSIYILPTPVFFWFLAIIIYHISLIFLYKFLIVPKIRISKKIRKKMKKEVIYKSKVIK